MAQSLSKLYVHIVFHIKYNINFDEKYLWTLLYVLPFQGVQWNNRQLTQGVAIGLKYIAPSVRGEQVISYIE
jgi:hypothetical protein